MSKPRAYIVSYPRSGNTWARLLLEYALGFETTSIYAQEQNERKLDMRHPISRVTINDQHIVREPQIEIVKSHAFAIGGDAPVIYLLRDGRDATVSYWHFARSFWKRPMSTFSEFQQGLYESGDWWPDHVAHWLHSDQAHPTLVVRFEDLVVDQEKELNRMLTFLKLKANRQFAEFADVVAFDRLHKVIPAFFREGKAGYWRNTYSVEDEAFFREHDAGMLTHHGYESSEGQKGTKDDLASRMTPEVLAGWIRRYESALNDVNEKDGEIRRLSEELNKLRQMLEPLNQSLVEKEQQIHLLHSVAQERLIELEKKEEQIKAMASHLNNQAHPSS